MKYKMTYSSHAIILGMYDVHEYDRMYTVYTRDFGKEEARATGIRKIKSKLSSQLQPFNLVDCMFARGKRGERLIQATTLERFPSLGGDLSQIAVASWCAELVDQLTEPGVKDVRIFDLTLSALRQITLRAPFERAVFALQLFEILGFGAVLDRCVRCREERGQSFQYGVDPSEGGIVCFSCATEAPFVISGHAVEALAKAVDDTKTALLHTVTESEQNTIRAFARQYIDEHLPWPLGSDKFVSFARKLALAK